MKTFVFILSKFRRIWHFRVMGAPPNDDEETLPPPEVTHQQTNPKTQIKDTKNDSGDTNITIPEHILQNAQPLWTNYLVGYFTRDTPHIGKAHAIVNRLWSMLDKPSMLDSQFIHAPTLLFCIDNPVIRAQVLEQLYWHIRHPFDGTFKSGIQGLPHIKQIYQLPQYGLISMECLQYVLRKRLNVLRSK